MEELKIRLDLHTHSIISYDGGITDEQYRKLLADEFFCVAITDHNEISFAKNLQSQLGNRVIVGEEILTADGEIIGLFLNNKIEPGLSVMETILRIKAQNGLVYVPHPQELSRKGLTEQILDQIVGSIDIIEVYNARTREPWLNRKSEKFAAENNIAPASSSDAHGIRGIRTAFNKVEQIPTRETMVGLLKAGKLIKSHAPLLSLLDPLTNKILKKLNL